MLGLCDRFKCLPSQLMDESAELLRWLRIEELARPEGGEQEWPEGPI